MKSLRAALFFSILSFSLAHAFQSSGYAIVNGARLWYEIAGAGEPLVLVAGGPGFSHVYFKPHFSQLWNFTVIYYDGIGRGRSDNAYIKSDYSIDRDVADLEGLRVALNIEKWHIYGHSYGGLVAQQYALQHQDHLLSLILSNTMHSFEMWQEGYENYYNEIRNQYPEAWSTIKRLADQGKKESSPEMRWISIPTMPLIYFYDVSNVEKIVSDSLPWNADVYYAIVGEELFHLSPRLQNLDFRPRLREINVPMLILAGRYDRIALPRYQIQYEIYAPQAEFHIFEKSGHFPFLEEPGSHIQLIREFLLRRQ
ncbi:alpha/beta fold hydrolase [candidate division KSB1 bacterium]|nr:alpha/beta fold hydrolase [candidate division KSB1 bacterium]